MNKFLTIDLLILALGACYSPGQVADDNALWPAVQMAWPAVKADIVAGGGDPSAFDVVIQSKDTLQLTAILGTWGSLRDVAVGHIDARVAAFEIAPGVGVSLKERVANFELSLIQLIKPSGVFQ